MNQHLQLLQTLEENIPRCIKCSRLVAYREEVARKKVRRFLDWKYWGKPVPAFGDPRAQVLIIGLAPAAHGANRTGRMFTGDSSGDWLYRALFETGFANQPHSLKANDGLRLKNIFISAVARCAPPDNKPLPSEIENCSVYLEEELRLLKNLEIVVCLGQISFNRFCKLHGLKKLQFGHGKKFSLDSGLTLFSSYHPSKQNTQTGKLKWEDWLMIFKNVREELEKKDSKI